MHFSGDLRKTFALLLRMQTWHAHGAYACDYITSERRISNGACIFLSPASWSWHHHPARKAHRFKMLTCLCHIYLSSVFVFALWRCLHTESVPVLHQHKISAEMGHSVSKPRNGPRQTSSSALQSRCIEVQPKSLPFGNLCLLWQSIHCKVVLHWFLLHVVLRPNCCSLIFLLTEILQREQKDLMSLLLLLFFNCTLTHHMTSLW